jgi:leucyl aminopeptidase
MTTRTPSKLIPADFAPTPSVDWIDAISVRAVGELDGDAGALGITVATDADVPEALGLDRDALERAGFEGKAGQTLVLPQASGPALVAVGVGAGADLTEASLRDAAAAFARATSSHRRVGLRVTATGGVPARRAAQLLAEGLVLARYRYSPLKQKPKDPALERAEILVDGADQGELEVGVERANATVRAAVIARDLANTPPSHLTATNMADIAVDLGAAYGFEVEVFDKQALIDLGCGGLLGVNAGSVEEPRMIALRYGPADPSLPTGTAATSLRDASEPAGVGPSSGAGTLAMVGKGIMYDSGGISLKPSDPMHLLMKMDMGGAGAILGAFTAFAQLGVAASVNAWLMCTDNMPSGSAYKLGDVLTARNGKTVEVKNTDAEGRLAMMDGLALAAESAPDAIIDVATLTGAALMALGQLRAATFSNDDAFAAQVESASTATDEKVWRMPLERSYRKQLDSQVADISNLGGTFAGATTAALFLDEFVAGIPWAHIDIAGSMQSDADDSWRSAGATGYGARLLVELAERFTAPR